MIFKRFYLSIIIQVILIGITASIFVWTFSQEYMLITRYSLAVLWVIQLILLIHFINRINRDVKKFLLSIKYNDPTIKFNTGTKDSFRELHESFAEILDAFGRVRIEKESEYRFFQTTIEHINVGLIAFHADGHIELSNKAAHNLLGLKSLVNISSLKKVRNNLPELLLKLKPNRPELISIKRDHKILKLSLNSTELIIKGKLIKIISIQNISNELEQEEMDAWQKLIRVITHEILNSVSPITLLASGLINIFEKDGILQSPKDLNENNIKDSINGLKVIQSRSKGLSAFVEEYRTSMQLPAPNFEMVSVHDLFLNMSVLFKQEFEKKNILFKFSADKHQNILADKKLIEQVLINLLNNAIYFTKNTSDPQIQLMAQTENQQTSIMVSDNGQGIEPEIMDQIFIPFFSTKEKGSGIGLSLSRQIMRMHNGNISVTSEINKGATFKLLF